jgi:hypothetical protein
MTMITFPPVKSHNHSVVNEPAKVMGFLSTAHHMKLRRIAAEMGVSETSLVSKFVREALGRKRQREIQ